MDKKRDTVEEIIELTGDNEAYYLSQATSGAIKIRGKFIRSETGRLRPVLVKTSYSPLQTVITPGMENPSWRPAKQHSGVTPSTFLAASRYKKWYESLLNWVRKFL